MLLGGNRARMVFPAGSLSWGLWFMCPVKGALPGTVSFQAEGRTTSLFQVSVYAEALEQSSRVLHNFTDFQSSVSLGFPAIDPDSVCLLFGVLIALGAFVKGAELCEGFT